jgi:hypothetical protein
VWRTGFQACVPCPTSATAENGSSHAARCARKPSGLGGATPLGFEPRITPPKGAVLPLHHGVIGRPTYDSRRRNGSCNSGGRTTRYFAGNDHRLVTFGNRERVPYNLNLGRGAIPAVWAGECQSWCRCHRHWKAKFFRHALPPPIGQWRGQDRCRSIFRTS